MPWPHGVALTARTEPGDPGRDGLQLFVRDRDTGCFWSVGHGPCRAGVDGGRFRLEHRQDDLLAVLEIGLVPGRPAELRRLTLTDLSGRTRRLDVTSCAAVVLNHPDAHAAHPVFSKLFLQTSWQAAERALLVRRRPREPGEVCPTLVHALLDEADVSFTTSRAAFLGRGRPWDRPAALAAPGPLDGQVGNVLDQVVSLRRSLTLDGGASASCTVLLGAAADPDAALALCAGLQDPAAVAAALAAASGLTIVADPPAQPASMPAPAPAAAPVPLPDTAPLRFDNGLGGFSEDGREYVIRVRPDRDGNLILPPQPWTNVLANDRLGCLVSETGAGCTWCGNSREHRLTPWSNDPVLDPHGETLHLRDDESGAYFSCLPGPTPAGGSYEMRHGLGYSRCRRLADGLDVDTLLFVAREDPVRVARVRVRNTGAGGAVASPCSAAAGWCWASTPAASAPRVTTSVRRRRPAPCWRPATQAGAFAAIRPSPPWRATPTCWPSTPAAIGTPSWVRRWIRPDRPPWPDRPSTAAAATGAGLGSLLRPPGAPRTCRPAPPPRSPSCWARRRTWTGCAPWCAKLTAPGGCEAPGARPRDFWRARPGRACRIDDAVAGPGPDGQRLAGLPDPGLPHLRAHGLLPVRRRLRLPRPAAGRPRPAALVARGGPASRSCCTPPTSSSRATCCTGGIRRTAAASARASPTTCSGCRC